MATDPFEIEALLGAYALDAVDLHEARIVEEYLLANPRARAEVQEHREVATMLAWSGTDAPDGPWERIAAMLEGSAAEPAANLASVLPLRAGLPRRRWQAAGAWAAASAAAALIAVVAVRVSGSTPDASSANGVERAVAAAMADPASTEAQLTSATHEEMKVRAVVDPQGHGFLMADSLPELDAAHTYQLWGQIDGELISLGVLGSRPSTEMFTVSGTLTLLAITDEVGGGVQVSKQPVVVAGAPA